MRVHAAVASFVLIACCALFAPEGGVAQRAGGTTLVLPGPTFLAPSPCGQQVEADFAQPTTFTVAATATTGLPGNSVTLHATQLPPGATQTPPLPLVATGPTATVTSTFTWIPNPGATLPYVIVYTATDQLGQSTDCTVTLVPVIECYLLLGLTEITFPLGPEPDDVLLVLPLVGDPVTTAQVPGLVIPNNPVLVNLSFAAQVGMFDPWLHPSNPLQMSNGLRVTIGVGTQAYGLTSGIDLFGTTPPMPGTTFQFAFTIQ